MRIGCADLLLSVLCVLRGVCGMALSVWLQALEKIMGGANLHYWSIIDQIIFMEAARYG